MRQHLPTKLFLARRPPCSTMTKTAVVLVALAAVVAACAWAEPDSPYRQHMDGIPLESIVCRDGFVLLGSPDRMPACVTAGTAAVLSERGWATVNGLADLGRRIVIDSRDLPSMLGAPEQYPHPVLIVDYPELMRVGQEYSIYVNYTYSQVPDPRVLPDPFMQSVNFTFGGNIDLLSTDFAHLPKVNVGTGGPYEHSIREAYKRVDVDRESWNEEEIRFRINAPMNYHGNQLHVNIGGMVVHGWLSTDDAGIVTVSNTQHFPDSVLDEDGRNKYSSRALEAPEDQGTGFPPINDDLYEFLKEHIQPHWDVPEWLRTDGDFPQDYIDELLAAYPDLAEPAAQADPTSGQP